MQQYKDNGVRDERTEWRDQEISRRHREWGFDCPGVDIDFLLVEYNFGKPVGLVEYKHFLAQQPNVLSASYRAMCALADSAGIPFIIAFYWPESWSFKVTPVNDVAKMHFESGQVLSEEEYVKKMYHIRRLSLNDELRGKLNKCIPPSVK